jgi:hypothetical protein
MNKRHLIGKWLHNGAFDLAVKIGLVQLHSAQPHSEAYQTIHHVGTTLGKGRCNLATGQAARRIDTSRMNPHIRSLEIPQAGMLHEGLHRAGVVNII